MGSQEYEKNSDIKILRAAARKMIHEDPALRLTAHEAVHEIRRAAQAIGFFGKRRRIWDVIDNHNVFSKMAIQLGRSDSV